MRKCRTKLEKISNQEIKSPEVLLGISTASIGSILGALASEVKFELGWSGIIFYALLPMVFIGCAVGFYFKRKE